MIIESVPIVNFSYLADEFTLSERSPLHYTQENCRKIKAALLYWIPAEESEETVFIMHPELLPRLAYVTIPKGCPILRVRSIINHVEARLIEIFKSCKRANIILVSEDEGINWRYEFDIPLYNVAYV